MCHYIIFSIDPSAPDYFYNQPKFIVFYDMLLKIFLLFCFNCKAANPQVTMRQNGTMVTVKQQCSKCIKGYVWNSQSYTPHGKYPTGNNSYCVFYKICIPPPRKGFTIRTPTPLETLIINFIRLHLTKEFLIPSLEGVWIFSVIAIIIIITAFLFYR